MQQKRKLTLGDPKQGIWLQNWRLRFEDVFLVEQEEPPFSRFVDLRNGSKVFRLTAEGGFAYVEIYGVWFLFHPFLKIEWLKKMIGAWAA